MQQPFPTPQPNPENQIRDCVCMELQLLPMQPKGLVDKIFHFKAKVTGTEYINLQLNIQFNERWEPLLGGRVKFGVKGGELRLKLENAEIPLASRELGGSFDFVVQQEQPQDNNIQVASGKTKVSADKFPFTSRQIATKDAKEQPGWVFEAEIGESLLKGLLKNAHLGTLNIIAKPCRVEATFNVSMVDLRLTATEGLWSSNLSREQQVILDRGIAKLLLKHKLNPYLSRVELHYV